MRKNVNSNENSQYKIIAVDDESGVLDTLKVFLNKSGYSFVGITDPMEAIERVKVEHFDLMLLDFIMTPVHGDQVVEAIRTFNKDLYILLLTGHKDLAPPLETIRRLDIQGYCEKSDKFDQLLLLVESGIKAVAQMNLIRKINTELKDTYDKLEKAYMESVETLRYTVEAKDTYTRGHSDRVSEYSVLLGKKLGLSDQDVNTLKIGGLFHDIGKAADHEMEGSHVDIGVELANRYRENEVVINAIASHHGDKEPTSVISHLVAAADTLSAARPGARSESLENYIKRLTQLEEICNGFKGVDKSYALQAGREIRILVKPDEVDDNLAYKLARDIRVKIENTLNYPGTIKVTVIRETRAQETAK